MTEISKAEKLMAELDAMDHPPTAEEVMAASERAGYQVVRGLADGIEGSEPPHECSPRCLLIGSDCPFHIGQMTEEELARSHLRLVIDDEQQP